MSSKGTIEEQVGKNTNCYWKQQKKLVFKEHNKHDKNYFDNKNRDTVAKNMKSISWAKNARNCFLLLAKNSFCFFLLPCE